MMQDKQITENITYTFIYDVVMASCFFSL